MLPERTWTASEKSQVRGVAVTLPASWVLPDMVGTQPGNCSHFENTYHIHVFKNGHKKHQKEEAGSKHCKFQSIKQKMFLKEAVKMELPLLCVTGTFPKLHINEMSVYQVLL